MVPKPYRLRELFNESKAQRLSSPQELDRDREQLACLR